MLRHRIATLLFLCCSLAACADLEDGAELDAVDADLPVGDKGDTGGIQSNGPDAYTVLRAANRATLSELRDGAGLGPLAAGAIVAYRLGDDEKAATADDKKFDDIWTLDNVPYIGPNAFHRLLAWGKKKSFTPPLIDGQWTMFIGIEAATALAVYDFEIALGYPDGRFRGPMSDLSSDRDDLEIWARAEPDSIHLKIFAQDVFSMGPFVVENADGTGKFLSSDRMCGELTAYASQAGAFTKMRWVAIRTGALADDQVVAFCK